MPNICYSCKTPFTKENASYEHVIPNSIGGVLKSKKLLCKKCNELFGSTIDAEFAKQLDPLCVLLGIKREREKKFMLKDVQSQGGEIFDLIEGYAPIRKKPHIEKTKEGYSITARTEKEMMHILKKLQKKHPEISLENIKEKFSYSSEYLQEPVIINLGFGGNEFMRAVCKIAVNSYLKFGGEIELIESAIEFVNGKIDNNNRVRVYFPEDSQISTSHNEVSHLVQIKNDQARKILYAYVLLFNSYGFVIILTDNYTGEDVDYLYCYDVKASKKIQKNILVNHSPSLPVDLESTNERYLKIIQKNISRLMSIVELASKLRG